MNKIIKKVAFILPLIIGIVLAYCSFSGKLDNLIKNAKEKAEEVLEDDNDEVIHVQADENGVISLGDNWEWDIKPSVDEYDCNNKIAKNLVYGITVAEMKHRQKCYDEQTTYNENNNIPDNLKIDGVYRKDEVIEEGEEFVNNFYLIKGKYDNVRFCEDIGELDAQYFGKCKNYLMNNIDENGKIKDTILVEHADLNREEKDVVTGLNLITLDITITSESEWVYEYWITPTLVMLKEKNDVLLYSESVDNKGYYFKEDELEEYTYNPVYLDLGLYDMSNHGNETPYLYPMRKGESITFKVGYLVPDVVLDNAYLKFDPMCTSATEESYNAQDRILFKLHK